jgi:hypothetical protein
VHSNPIGLRYQLNDNVVFTAGGASTLDSYVESTGTLHHSPIVGWAYDGYPIYGPYGYSSSMNAASGVRRMVSGFQKRNGTNSTTALQTTGRKTLPAWAARVHTPYHTNTLALNQQGPNVSLARPLGYYCEDFEWLGDVGVTTGYDLDQYNGRTCVTPEYPGGTYAYFTTINSDGTYAFPCLVGPAYYGVYGGNAKIPSPPGGATVSFTAIQDVVKDGTAAELNYTVNPTKGATGQPLGRFAVLPSSTGLVTHGAFTISLGTVTGLSNIKLERTTTSTYVNATQVGSTVASPASSMSFTDNYTTSAATYYWLKGDVSAGATGSLDARLTTYTLTGAIPASFSGNDALANSPVALGSSTYTWVGSISGDYQVAGNWTPTRTTPASTDILVFDGAQEISDTITNIPTQTIASFSSSNNAAIGLTANSAATLTCTNGFTIGGNTNIYIGANTTVSLGANSVVTGYVEVVSGGTLKFNSTVITGTGTAGVNNGGTLETKNAAGFTNSGASGALQTTTRFYYNGASFQYDSVGAQVTGDALPESVQNLSAGSGTILTLSGDTTVNGAFTTTGGNCSISTGAHIVTLTGTASLVNFSSLIVSSGGRLNLNSVQVLGTGTTTFLVGSGATLETMDVNGLAASGATGAVQTTNRLFDTGASYIFDAGSAQVTGTGLPSTVANLAVMSELTILTLTSNLSVTGALTCSGSGIAKLQTGTHVLSLGSSANLGVTGRLYVQSGGRLNTNNVQIAGSGISGVEVLSGATVETKHVYGFGTDGAIATGGQSYSTGATYILDGTSAQVTGNEMPTSVAGLTVNNPAGVSQSFDLTMTGLLTITAGTLSTNGWNLTMNSSGAVAGALNVVSGSTLEIANGSTFTGAGSVTVASGATVNCKSIMGLDSSFGMGTFQNSTTSLSPDATYAFAATSLQGTGSLLPTTVANVVINNPTTVTLLQSTTVTTQLALTQGVLDTRTLNATLVAPDGDGNSGIVRGTGSVYGPLTRIVNWTNGWFRVFPLCNAAGGYVGADIVTPGSSSASGTVTISSTDGDPPNALSTSGVLDRYWTVTANGFDPAGCELQLHYLQSDVSGSVNENTMVMTRYTGGVWQEFTPDFRDVAGNIVTRYGVPGFSIWSVANPGSVPVAVSRFTAE